jgi:hypothetical protein
MPFRQIVGTTGIDIGSDSRGINWVAQNDQSPGERLASCTAAFTVDRAVLVCGSSVSLAESRRTW